MFVNYLKTAIRHMNKYKTYSLINIAGLAAGMAVCLLILLWVADELSYDQFNKNKDQIRRLCVDLEAGSHMVYPMTMPVAAPLLIEEFPEITNAVRIERPHRVSVEYQDIIFHENGVCHGDNSIFEIFTFPISKGDSKTALTAPYSVVLTESIAKKYYGDKNPIGEIIKINGDHEYNVTAVMKDVPQNSHFRFNLICSFETLYSRNRAAMENWFHIQFYTYLQFAENSNPFEFEKKLPDFINKHMGSNLKSIGGSLDMFLQPLNQIHLYSSLGGEIAPQGNINYVYLFSGIALFVLIIACINFINLATARSSVRSREIGMRKTLGAGRERIALQFLVESAIYSLSALFLAVVLVNIFLPQFNTIIGKKLTLISINLVTLFIGTFGLTLLVGILAGVYPALYLSNLQPIKSLKGGLRIGANRSRFRNGLVVFQFAISIVLIIGTVITSYQIRFMKHKDPGFKKGNVLIIPRAAEIIQKHSIKTIREELKVIPQVKDVGGSSLVPSRGIQRAIMYPEGYSESQPQMGEKLFVDAHYVPIMGIELSAGRNFSEDFATDPTESIIINETAANIFGWKDPIGKTFTFKDTQGDQKKYVLKVIGVVKDFHSASLHRQIEPLIFYYETDRINFFALKIAPNNISQTINSIKKTWAKLVPNRPFDFFFLDESLDMMYRTEERLGKIALSFCLLAIFIGCLGLFGLAAFIVEQRTKEIGIRKVMGATNQKIINLLSKEFVILILISNLVAWPIAYFSMNSWLQNFAYRASIEWWIFLLAGILGLAVAVFTIGFQAVKAVRINPVESLKYE